MSAGDFEWGNQWGNPQGTTGSSSETPDSPAFPHEQLEKLALTLLPRSSSFTLPTSVHSSSLRSSSTPRSRSYQERPDISIGQWISYETSVSDVYVADPALRPHVGKPWLDDWLYENGAEQEHGSGNEQPAGDALLKDEHLSCHTFILGKSGFGKSRLAVQLAAEQVRSGCSVVAVDPKDQSVLHLIDALRDAGLAEDKITLALPGYGHPPAWNPLDCHALGVTAAEAARSLVGVLREMTSGDGWGPRMSDILTNAAMLAAAHALSLWEVVELLRDARFREALLAKPPVPGLMDDDTYAELMAYFRFEFPALTRGGNLEAVLPVINKIRDPLRLPFLRGMFTSRRPAFDLSSLWREPQALLVNLDREKLGSEGAQLLGGLLVRQLFSTALGAGGKGGCPVVLLLDEIAIVQHSLGKGIGDTLAMARSYDLRVVAACQHLAKLSPEMRADLTAIPSIRVFFRPADGDVAEAARVASLEAPAGPPKVAMNIAGTAKVPLHVSMTYPVLDAAGGTLSLSEDAWGILQESPLARKWEALENLMEVSQVPGPPQIEHEDAGSFLHGLRDSDWVLSGPSPLSVTIRFPQPKVDIRPDSASERERRWEQRLRNLPRQHALVFTPSHIWPCEVQVARVADPRHDQGFLEAVLSRNPSDAQVSADLAARRADAAALIEAHENVKKEMPAPERTHTKADKPMSAKPRQEDWDADDSI